MNRSWIARRMIIPAAAISGVLAALMTNWGNPANMGICIVCFLSNSTLCLGGLIKPQLAQELQPIVIGFVLGSSVAALAFGEFHSRGGASPVIRFLLGVFLVFGALVFIGCPTRMLLRIAGGDLNGLTGMGGLVLGIWIGVLLFKRGFDMGRRTEMHPLVGWSVPLLMIGLLILGILRPGFRILTASEGLGSTFAPLNISLAVGLVIGFLAQRTRMCFVGGWRDLFLVRDTYLFSGIISFFAAALITNYAVGNFATDGLYHWGFLDQPIAIGDPLWNFLGMTLVGLAATLVGGCPLRNLVLSGEGDTDAAMTVLGYFVGSELAHRFFLTSTQGGIGLYGPRGVIIGLASCLALGLVVRKKGQ